MSKRRFARSAGLPFRYFRFYRLELVSGFLLRISCFERKHSEAATRGPPRWMHTEIVWARRANYVAVVVVVVPLLA
jgi:hypothetical protein